jgi:hypothetical protein
LKRPGSSTRTELRAHRVAHWSFATLRPRCVVIWITPFAAREPYSDAAAAPLTISIDSMSIASMSTTEADRITPSTM